MVHQRTIGIVVVLACHALLSGCGGGGDSGATAQSSTAAAAAAATTTTSSSSTSTSASASSSSSSSVSSSSASGSSASSAAVPAVQTPAAVSAVLTIDFATIANYASPALPAYYDATVAADDNTPAFNPIVDRIATLGRVLFYDRKLSLNDGIACASCHRQSNGFEDPARFSAGFSGAAFTTAHAMRLANARYFRPGSMFWNKRAASLEAQSTQPVQNAVEMGFDAANGGIEALLSKLRAVSYYPDLFAFAFGDAAINESRIQLALSQFERAMISADSRWDRAYAQVFNAAAANLDVTLPGFSDEENRGRHLFMASRGAGGLDCAACHVPPTFSLLAGSGSNGLDAGETVRFKSPSLKNVGLGGAFMHDGRFATLEDVVEHYDHGVQAGPALDNRLMANGAPRRLNLSTTDKAALAAFMRTLTDTSLMSDARFSTPFR